MKCYRAHVPTAAVPALLSPHKVGEMRGRVGAAATQTSFHISFSFRIEAFSALHWPRSLSPQSRRDLGLHSFQRLSSLPVQGSRGSSFLLWGCCKSTLRPGAIRLQQFHCKKCLKEETVLHFLSWTALWNRYCFPGQWYPVLTPPKWQEKHLGSQSYLTHRVAWRTI